jgi:hypothetical protein
VLFGLFAVTSQARANGLRRILPALFMAAVTGSLTVLVWLIPVAQSAGGFERYLALVRAHSAHVSGVDSLFAQAVTADTLRLRWDAFVAGLLALVGGASWVGLLTLLVAGIGLLRAPWYSAFARLCGLWLVGGAVQVFLWNSLARPRLYLLFVPPLMLLTALGWLRPATVRRVKLVSIAAAVPVLLSVIFAATSVQLAATLTGEPSPPLQATAWSRAIVPAGQSVVVALGSLRAAQIALADYRLLYLGQYDPAWGAEIAARQTRYLVLLDRDDVWDSAYSTLTSPGNYVPILERQFSRDPRVFPQHSLVRVEILVPLSSLLPDQLALPTGGEIAIGASSSTKYLGAGWYRSEIIAGTDARWAQQEAVIRAALPPVDYTLTLEGTPYPAGQQVELVVNGQTIGTLTLGGVWEARSISIPSRALAGAPITTIVLRHASADTPPGSDRRLAAAYRRIIIAAR